MLLNARSSYNEAITKLSCNLILIEQGMILHPCDIWGKLVRQQLQSSLNKTDYLDHVHSGFRPGHGVKTAMLALVNDLKCYLDLEKP